MGRHRSDPRGLGRYLLLGVVGVVALALVVVGVLALRGALSSKKPPHTPTPTPTQSSTSAALQQSTPVLLIKIIREPCLVFVKNAVSNNVLRPDNTPPPLHATLVFAQVPLQVQISDPHCANVYVHGRKLVPGAAAPWIFSVQT